MRVVFGDCNVIAEHVVYDRFNVFFGYVSGEGVDIFILKLAGIAYRELLGLSRYVACKGDLAVLLDHVVYGFLNIIGVHLAGV